MFIAFSTTPRCVLTIAGSDSGAGAGIQADLKAMAAHGIYGLTAITAVTAQNTVEVTDFQVMPADLVEKQIDAVMQDFPVAAVKTGMLASEEIIETVAERMKRYGVQNLVVDPVMVAKSGDQLLKAGAEASLCKKLFPVACLITPNMPEAEAICGFPVRSQGEMKKAARKLHQMGPSLVLVKGGHSRETGALVDILFDGKRFYAFRAARIDTRNTHGTGCTYASAIASGLAMGYSPPVAIKRARHYLQRTLALSLQLGKGHGPLGHFC